MPRAGQKVPRKLSLILIRFILSLHPRPPILIKFRLEIFRVQNRGEFHKSRLSFVFFSCAEIARL